MTKNLKFRVGNKLVGVTNVYRIFKIEEKKVNGEVKRLIHYKPFFETSINKSLICSIPEENICDAIIRRPVEKEVIKKIIKYFSKSTRRGKSIDSATAKEILKSNNINEISTLVKKYWWEKQIDSYAFTKNKSNILEKGLRKVAEEYAIVYQVALSSAEKILDNALIKSTA